MPSDFIDRAKLIDHAERVLSQFYAATYLAGVDAAIAQLNETAEVEWQHYKVGRNGHKMAYPGRKVGNIKPEYLNEWKEECRRVIYGPWLPSEGGEKP